MMKLISIFAISTTFFIQSIAFGVAPMIYGESTRLDALDPYTSHELAAQRLSDLIFDDLITTTTTGDYRSSLAQDWKIQDQGSVVLVKLNPSITWHDNPNNRVSADDIITTIRLLNHPSSHVPNKNLFSMIEKAEKIDQHNVRISYSRALGDPLKPLTFKVLPHHLLKAETHLTKVSKFGSFPIGTGPYKLAAVSKNGEIRLKKNPSYFRGSPAIPEIIMKSYSDQSIMAQSLMYSSLDLMTYVSPRDLPEIIGDQKLGIIPYDALSFTFFAINMRQKTLQDKRTRQAICHAINRKEMLEAFFHNRGTLISGPFPPTSWAYNLEVKGYSYDPERSKELLKSAGYNWSGNKWEDTNKNQLKLRFSVPIGSEGETIKRISLAFKNYLEDIGIPVELKFMDWLVWKKKVLKEHDYDLTIASWSFDDASNITSLFHSGYKDKWGNNFVGFNNPEVDMMLTEASSTNDFDKRRAIYQKLHAILADEAPYAYLWTLMHHAAHSNQISNISIEPQAIFKHVAKWKKRSPQNGQ